MSFVTERRGTLEFLRSDNLETPHGFSTRLGGVSQGHLASLNLGVHRGDRPRNVLENYRRFAKALGFDYKKLVFTHQTHTAIVRAVDGRDAGQGLVVPVEPECDGLVTNTPGLALAAFTADCTPILLCDPIAGAAAAVHAGWRGTAAGIVAVAVAEMSARYGCDPANIRAAVGPRIGKCCFETDRDVPDAMLAALGVDALDAVEVRGDKFHVDLAAVNAAWLRRAGVTAIDTSADCTCCRPDRFWSHRVVGWQRGSLAAVIVCPAPMDPTPL